MSASAAESNCVAVVAPFVEGLQQAGLTHYVRLMGGVGSAALMHPGTHFDDVSGYLETSRDFTTDNPKLGLARENGTPRDLDTLVVSQDPNIIQAVADVAEQTIGNRLQVEVFGLQPGLKLYDQTSSPFGIRALKTVLSDRYVCGDALKKSIFPFAVDLDPDALRPWTLVVDGQQWPTLGPGATLLNYLTRSISGLRPKDTDKFHDMAANVFNKLPDIDEWIVDGPGRGEWQLAGILQTLRRSNSWPRRKRELAIAGGALSLRAGSIEDYRDDPSFVLRDRDPAVEGLALWIATAKSRALGIAESNELIVKLWQRFGERHVDSITHNQ